MRARREVILAGGAFNTPQLLKLSGIGPRAELERSASRAGWTCPGVGQNLQDRYEVGVVSRGARGLRAARAGSRSGRRHDGETRDPMCGEWPDGRGVYTTNGALLGIVRRSRPELARPRPVHLRAARRTSRATTRATRGAGPAERRLHLGGPQGAHREPRRQRAAALGRSARPPRHPVPLLRRGRRRGRGGPRRGRHRHRGGAGRSCGASGTTSPPNWCPATT